MTKARCCCAFFQLALFLPLLFVGTTAALAQAQPKFEPGSTMDKIQKRGKLIVGSRINQPAVAQLNPITGKVEGFEADIARAIAVRLGLKEDQVEFPEVVSSNREPAITQGLVDIVVTAYVITPERRTIVGQAGPYLIAHNRVFVHRDNAAAFKTTDDLKGKRICTAPTGTPVPVIKKFGGILVPFDDNNACSQQVANKNVEAKMSNDLNTIGSLQQYPDLVMADIPNLTDEGWGIGLKKDDAAFCSFLIGALNDIISTGDWQKFWDADFTPVGAPPQKPPAVEQHC